MNFGVLDFLRTSRYSRNFTLENAVTRRTPLRAPITSVPCKRYCAFRECAIADNSVTPADCATCRTHDVFSGAIADKNGQRFRITDGVPQFSRRVLASDGIFRIVELDYRTDPRLDPFIDACPHGLVFHHPGWMETLAQEYGQECLVLGVEDCEGWLRGILPMFYTRGLPFNIGTQQVGRRLACLPRTPMAGPVATDSIAMAALLTAAVGIAKSQHGVQLQIKTTERLPRVDNLIATSWRPTYVLSLPDTPEQLRFGDAHSRHHIKWAVNKAAKLGLVVREAQSETELREWYRLYLETMRRNVALARPYRFFRAQWKHLRPLGLMKLLLAEQASPTGKRLVAGSIFLSSGRTVFYAFTGCRTADLRLHPNDIVLWEAIHQACRDGCRYFDFGEVPEQHPDLVRFKTKWGAKPRAMQRYYSSIVPGETEQSTEHEGPPVQTMLNQLWQAVPLVATAVLADWAYSFL